MLIKVSAYFFYAIICVIPYFLHPYTDGRARTIVLLYTLINRIMKIAASLLQTMSLAVLIPCAASCGDAHTQTLKHKIFSRKDSVKTRPSDSLKAIPGDSIPMKLTPRTPKYCPGCGMG